VTSLIPPPQQILLRLPVDPSLEFLQLLARFEPELFAERLAGLPVRIERVGLSAGAVEGEHQLSL
jgi:hypothetical protein